MRRFFDSKSAFATILFLFAGSISWNITHGSGAIAIGHQFLAPVFAPELQLAHGPTVPPDPWDVRIAHGPTVPPDPWDVRIAG